jgi:hypothetical protein
MQYLYPEELEENSEPVVVKSQFSFWENKYNPNIKSGSLLHQFDKANLITKTYSQWMINRFDESQLSFFRKRVKLMTQNQFMDNMVLALQGIPNELFDIHWGTWSETTHSFIDKRNIEIGFDANVLSSETTLFLQENSTYPVCTMKVVQIQDYTLSFTSSLLKKLKNKLEQMLEVYQIILQEEHVQQNYFEKSLLRKVKELVVSFYTYRVMNLQQERVSQFVPEFNQFYSEMNEILRFLRFCNLSTKGLLDLCYAFKASISKDSSLFVWIQRYLYFSPI